MTTYQTISIYDFNDKFVRTYHNVPIPESPTWKNDLECLHYLRQKCPKLVFNGVYAIQPYHNAQPLSSLEGSIYPEISPAFQSVDGWDLKLTQIGLDIATQERLAKIETTLDSLQGTMQSLNTTMDSLAGVLKELKVAIDDDFTIVHPLKYSDSDED